MKIKKMKYSARYIQLFLVLALDSLIYFFRKDLFNTYIDYSPKEPPYFGYGFVIFCIIVTLWVINLVSRIVIIDDVKLTYKSIFINKEMLFKDIKRIDTKEVWTQVGDKLPIWIRIIDNKNKVIGVFFTHKMSRYLGTIKIDTN